MKQIKNHHIIIFLFIFLLNLEYSKCEDCSNTYCNNANGYSCSNSGTQTCPYNCKPKYIEGDGTCHDCNGISPSTYYTIKSDGTCSPDECLGDKIIADSKECTSQIISSLYKLGDFYYNTNPTSNSCPGNICSCPSYFYTEKIYGKKK